MKDQVDALVNRGIKAAQLDSSLDAAKASWVKSEVLSGKLKILYVAPERSVTFIRRSRMLRLEELQRLNNELFIAMISRVKISLLAVDESHCISQVCRGIPPLSHI